MGLPKKLINYNTFNEGNSYMGITDEVTLPKITHAMDDWRGGGMIGPVKVDNGLEALEMEMTVGGIVKQLLRQMGITAVDGVLLRFVGAYRADDGTGVDQVEVVTRGRWQELDMGNAKAGAETAHKVKAPLSYYKLTINNRVEIEIDMLNSIYMVDGVDRYAEIRAAIGI